MRFAALQPSVQSAHAARALHSLLPAYTEPVEDSEIGTFPPTGVSLVMELPVTIHGPPRPLSSWRRKGRITSC